MIKSSSSPVIILQDSKPMVVYYGPSVVVAENDNTAYLQAGGTGAITYTWSVYGSEADEAAASLGIRPVVILDPNIKITGGNGNAPSTAYQLDLSKY